MVHAGAGVGVGGGMGGASCSVRALRDSRAGRGIRGAACAPHGSQFQRPHLRREHGQRRQRAAVPVVPHDQRLHVVVRRVHAVQDFEISISANANTNHASASTMAPLSAQCEPSLREKIGIIMPILYFQDPGGSGAPGQHRTAPHTTGTRGVSSRLPAVPPPPWHADSEYPKFWSPNQHPHRSCSWQCGLAVRTTV